MNSIMERWIGSCRREPLDRTLIWNQRHVMSVLREYEDFSNTHRPHCTLNQAAPLRPLPDGMWMGRAGASPQGALARGAVGGRGGELALVRVVPGAAAGLMIATGIGLHNFAEGLAIGQSAASGELALATLLVIGFGLHNATRGPALSRRSPAAGIAACSPGPAGASCSRLA
jgi:zinc transporter ZupT